MRPNFGRQMFYAGIALTAVLAGYFLIQQFRPKSDVADRQATVENSSPSQPWYQQQSPPPTLVTTPDAPLFPDPEQQVLAEERAYEEALPREIYKPPSPPKSIVTENQAAEVTPPPWRRYAVDITDVAQRPLIAIVIDDMGVDKKRSARAIKMPGPLTLSFLTYAENLAEQTGLARANGHELMLHISMEPTSRTVDPGPNVLLTGLDDSELIRRLDWGFARFSGYVGINNHMGSKFTSDARAMGLVIEAVKKRGLLFLDSRTSATTVGAKLARQYAVPLAERNIFIDHVNTLEQVNARLVQVEKFARRNGYAVAIGHPRQATIEALEIWLKGIEAKGFSLVPISTIVARYGAS